MRECNSLIHRTVELLCHASPLSALPLCLLGGLDWRGPKKRPAVGQRSTMQHLGKPVSQLMHLVQHRRAGVDWQLSTPRLHPALPVQL
jgi:hypothetical protein